MKVDSDTRLITTAQMYEADRVAIAGGVSERQLIGRAGRAVFEEIVARWSPCKVLVLAGPGNNGADGREVARLLVEADWPITLWAYGDVSEPAPADFGLIVDSLFGAGLSRPLNDNLRHLVGRLNDSSVPVVSVDVPSGIDGNTGQACPVAIKADLTVTFFRLKPGHVLYPGRGQCGEIVCRDIGIGSDVLCGLAGPAYHENDPSLWLDDFPRRAAMAHKYHHGHVIAVTGGLTSTGAGRLAAMAAMRAGAGLVSVASPRSALMVNAAHLTEIMLTAVDEASDFAKLAQDERYNTIVIGPGLGLGERQRELVLAVLESQMAVVLDADALSLFKDAPELLFEKIAVRDNPVVLTPHAGEFKRLFGDLLQKQDSKLQAAVAASERSGAIVVFKGPDTIIASPDGSAVINTNAPPQLAVAGSGDVLAGILAGLLAQHMPAHKAACAAVWLHGAAGQKLGPGLIASELTAKLPEVVGELA